MVRVCFVCLGNICRSPTAEGIMARLVNEAGLSEAIALGSAGTGDWHIGSRPDGRALETARGRGFELPGRSEQFTSSDFERYDYVVAMDQSNRENLLALAASPAERAKVSLLRDHDPDGPRGAEVPDPYFGGPGGFDEVFDICEAGCQGLLAELRSLHDL